MIKFGLIYVISAYIIFKLITVKHTKELERMQKEERWSDTRIVFDNILFPLLNILGVVLLIILILPMTLDLPKAIKGNFSIHEGSLYNTECKLFCQNQVIYINEETKLKLYFNDELEKDEIYVIKYLPRSKFITAVEIVPNE